MFAPQKLLVWGCLAVAAAGLLFFSYSAFFREPDPSQITPLVYLRENNSDFRKGYAALAEKDYAAAISSFEESLDSVENVSQEAYVKRLIGSTKGFMGDYEGAVSVLKSVADNEFYSDAHRAHAITSMGNLFYLSHKNPVVTDLIFSSAPYRDFLKRGDVGEAYEKLFLYARTFYPTGDSGYRVALEFSHDKSTSTPLLLRQSMQDLQDEIIDLESVSAPQGILSDKYLELATLQGLSVLWDGVEPGKAERSFEKSLELAGTDPNRRISAGFYYALYLAQKYGSSRLSDIERALSPFYDPVYKDTQFYKFFLDERQRDNARVRINIAHIAKVSQPFQTLMNSLGW